MFAFTLIAIIFSVGINSCSGKLPDYVKKCKKGPEGAQCGFENAVIAVDTMHKNDGEPAVHLTSFSPIRIPRVDLQASSSLKVVLIDLEIYGIHKLDVKHVQMDDKEILLAGVFENLQFVGKYEIDGKILILPIKGQGNCNITLLGVDVDYKAKLQVVERKGKQYYEVEANENTQLTFPSIKRVYFKFENLFGGDEGLGSEMNVFLNENWSDVFSEINNGLEKLAAYSIANYFVNAFLHYTPINELFDE